VIGFDRVWETSNTAMTKEARLEPSEEEASSSGLVPVSDGSPKDSGTTRISRAPTPAPAQSADYNLRILWPLARYVEEKHGIDELTRIAASSHIDINLLDGRTHWISTESFEGFLKDVHTLVGSEEKFLAACVYRIKEAYGPLRYILWAMSPAAVFEQGIKTFRLMSRVGDPEKISVGRTHFKMRMRSNRPISREACLARQAQSAALPTIWGLPQAHVHEEGCIGLGDSSCEIEYSWYANNRLLPVLIGGLIGSAFGAVLFLVERSPLIVVLSGIIGLLLGHVFESRGATRANEGTRARIMEALTQLAHEEADARSEIMALGQRQRDWANLVEEAYTTRLDGLQGVMRQAEQMQQARESTLLGFSHDLRNPLMVLASTVEFLRENTEALGDEGPQVIEDVEGSITQMKRMLGDFVSAATSNQGIVRLRPQRLDVNGLTSSLTRRLRALLQGRPIVPSVMQTREAPEEIFFDPLVFDRVVDNLLTNAAKYTERGSIVVEVTGNDDFIIIQVSDSGRGIDEAELERIFRPGGSTKEKRARDSFGVGLSVVLELLEQVGGSLEVMSQPGRGTTFWANFPIGTEATLRPSVRPSAPSGTNISTSSGGALSARVRIRKPPA
jgi:signal transduction histidine kinase